MESIYRQLPAVRRTPVSKASVWVADDHLLSVQSSRVAEEYRRYYFRDIQALVIERRATSRKAITYPLLGILAAATTAVANAFGWWALLPGFLTAALALIEGSARECRCLIVTRTSQDFLPAFAKLRGSEAAMAELAPLILNAQRKEASDGGPDAAAVL